MEQEPMPRGIYARITEQIVAAIAAGAPTYKMPWHQSGPALARPANVASCLRYRGVNVLALWVVAQSRGYPTGFWATYRQWASLNAQVRKGERGTAIVFYREVERQSDSDEAGEPGRYLVARTTFVFNAAQVDGWEAPPRQMVDPVASIEAAEFFVQATGARIAHNRGRACYIPSEDYIEMPERSAFRGSATCSATDAYYATLFHELTHWSGHSKRLARNLANRFGDEAYAMEELIAELGAAFLCADLNVMNTPRLDHAAYIASWLRVLENDPRAIFTAAGKAGAAAEFLQAFVSSGDE